jgi:NADH:ubiquinone oxidoreductase subunit F (NADH-binding)
MQLNNAFTKVFPWKQMEYSEQCFLCGPCRDVIRTIQATVQRVVRESVKEDLVSAQSVEAEESPLLEAVTGE